MKTIEAIGLAERAPHTNHGHGFGPGGEGYVRSALIENEQRIAQALRNLRGVLKLT